MPNPNLVLLELAAERLRWLLPEIVFCRRLRDWSVDRRPGRCASTRKLRRGSDRGDWLICCTRDSLSGLAPWDLKKTTAKAHRFTDGLMAR